MQIEVIRNKQTHTHAVHWDINCHMQSEFFSLYWIRGSFRHLVVCLYG